MNMIKRLLQTMAAVAVVAVPLAAQAQPVPYSASPYGAYPSAYPYATTMYPGAYAYPSNVFARSVANTPLDPWAATVRVVPPQGGAVMLYRGNSVKGWWLQPAFLTVRPGEMYGLVATRGTTVLFNAAMVFQPGFTDIVWKDGNTPAVGFRPAMYPTPGGHPGYHSPHRRSAPAAVAPAHEASPPARPAAHAQPAAPAPRSRWISSSKIRYLLQQMNEQPEGRSSHATPAAPDRAKLDGVRFKRPQTRSLKKVVVRRPASKASKQQIRNRTYRRLKKVATDSPRRHLQGKSLKGKALKRKALKRKTLRRGVLQRDGSSKPAG